MKTIFSDPFYSSGRKHSSVLLFDDLPDILIGGLISHWSGDCGLVIPKCAS